MLQGAPIVLVADEDLSVRESLEWLTRCEGWQPETFASAQQLLDHPRVPVLSCLIFDVFLPGIIGLLRDRYATISQ